MDEVKTTPRISAKKAAMAARDYFVDLTGYRGVLTVEEIELSPDESRWLITLGYEEELLSPPRTNKRKTALSNILAPLSGLMIYKKFEVKTGTGEVVAMKMREV